MLIYIICFGLIPVYGLLIKNRKILVTIIGIQLFLLLGLRDITVGYDLTVYSSAFNYIKEFSFHELINKLNIISTADLIYPFNLESGYVFINWLISFLNFDFHTFLIILAAFNMISITYFIYKYSTVPWMSFLLFSCLGIYNSMFGLLRQSLTMCILIWSIQYIIEQKFAKFLIIVFMAFLVHRSAIVFIPIYFLHNYKVNKHLLINLGILYVIFIPASKYILNFFVTPVLKFFGKTSYSTFDLTYNNMIVLLFLILLIIILFVNMKKLNENIDNLSLWGLLLAFPIEIFGMYNEVMARILPFFLIFICLLLPKIVKTYSNYKVKVSISYLFPIILIIFEIYLLYGSPMYPYSFFF